MRGDRQIRVCIVVASIDITGGQAVQALRLVEGLSREPGIKAELLPINPRLPGLLRLLQRVKYVRTLVTSLAYIASLLVKLPRFDVVHVFSASYLSFLLAPTPAVLIARLYGKPVLLNYHSGEAEDHLRRWRRTAHPVVGMAHRIVVPSRYLADVFGRFGFRAHTIVNFVDAEQFPRRGRRQLRPTFLMNRHLEPHYNVACGLRAFSLIQHEMPSASLVVAGDGSCRAELERLSAQLQLHNVAFVGRLTPPRMAEAYASSDIFLNPASIDNLPLSILEAFAAGLPVVTTRAGGIAELVEHEHTGLLVEIDDSAGLAAAALRLLHDNALAWRLIEQARAYCEQQYGWASVAEAWLRLYTELSEACHSDPANGVESGVASD